MRVIELKKNCSRYDNNNVVEDSKKNKEEPTVVVITFRIDNPFWTKPAKSCKYVM